MSQKVGPIITMLTITEILRLNWLCAPSLPIGAFAWSQGLESAISQGLITNQEEFKDYLEVQLHYGLTTFDLPLLKRLQAAAHQADQDQVEQLDAWVKAGRGTRELLAEEEHLGRALLRLLRRTDLCPDWAYSLDLGYVAAFALAARELAPDAVLAAFALAWAQNLVTVACKVLPLGQTQGQQVLLALMPQLTQAAQRAMSLSDEAIGTALPGLMQLSCQHESQYTRLFRS
ncbi:MAG: urease accessory UreF family protein [Anaerobiospirillum sp.]|nr:urease accessory UreF family protein [Anaerobiospirillum sp.]